MSAWAQGTVLFSNSGLPPVYVCDETSLHLAPAGSTFQVALYYAPDGVLDETQFIQLGSAANFGPVPGFFSGGGRTAPTAIAGDWGMFQVRGWERAYGATYEQASMDPQARVGKSHIFRVHTTNPDSTGAPSQLLGLEGFVIASPTCVPEPHLVSWISLFCALLFFSCRPRSDNQNAVCIKARDDANHRL